MQPNRKLPHSHRPTLSFQMIENFRIISISIFQFIAGSFFCSLLLSFALTLSSCAPVEKKTELPVLGKSEKKFPKIIKKEKIKEDFSKDKDSDAYIRVYNEGVAFLKSDTDENRNNAELKFKEAIDKKKSFWPSYYNLAYIYLQKNLYDHAEGYLRNALEYNNEDVKIYYLLAEIFSKKNNIEKAFELYTEIAENYDDPIPAYFQMGNILMSQKDYENAIEVFNKAGKATKKNYKLFLNKGTCYLYLNSFENAVKSFKAVYDLGIKDLYLLKQYGYSLRKNGDLTSAVKVFEEIVNQYPEELEVYKNIGIIYELYLNKPDKAIPFYEKYIAKEGKDLSKVKNWLNVSRDKVKQ